MKKYILVTIAILAYWNTANALPVSNFQRSIYPEINNTYDLGTPSQYWKNLYAGTSTAGSFTATSTTATSTFSGDVSANKRILVATTTTSQNGYVIVGKTVTNGTDPRHAFLDQSVMDFSGDLGYASYDAFTNMAGSNAYNHFVGFQSRPTYSGSGGITNYFDSINSAAIHSGAGTVATMRGLRISDVGGTGPITNNYGLYIDSITRGTNNYAIYSAGGSNYFGGETTFGSNVGLGVAPTSRLSLAGASTISVGTADGADNSYMYLSGGGTASASRGGYVLLTGNEQAQRGGIAFIPGIGDGASNMGSLHFYKASGPTEVMTIASSGNVGIGTTTPAKNLEISGSSGAALRIADTNVADPTYWDFAALNASGAFSLSRDGTQIMRIRTNGNVGFGTDTTPDYRFGVEKETTNDYFGVTNTVSGDVMIIKNSGYVGIGTVTPQANLHVLGMDANGAYTSYTTASAIIGSTDDQQIRIYNDTTNNKSAIQSQVYGGDAAPLILNPTPGQNGKVGIGITAPEQRLHVYDTLTTGGTFASYSDKASTNGASFSGASLSRMTSTQTSASFSGEQYGGVGEFWIGSGNTQNWTGSGAQNQSGAVGFMGRVEKRGTGTFTVSNAQSFVSQAEVGGNGTFTNYMGYRALVPTGAGVITSSHGFYSNDMTKGASLNTGFTGAVTAGTGKYNLYMSGTAQNYLAGNLGIGTTTPTTNIQANGTTATSTISATVVNGGTRSTTLGGKIILQDMAGGTCTEITTQSGVMSARAVTCP